MLAMNLRALLDEVRGAGPNPAYSPARTPPERLEVRRAVAALHCSGAHVDWSALHPRGCFLQVSLPAASVAACGALTASSVAMRAERLATDYVHPFLQNAVAYPEPRLDLVARRGGRVVSARPPCSRRADRPGGVLRRRGGLPALARAIDPGCLPR